MVQQAYIHFSVSLDEWLHILQSGGTLPSAPVEDGLSDGDRKEATCEGANNACTVSVGFIQVCRNSLRSYGDSWNSLGDPCFLKHVYESGTTCFVHPGCPLLDLFIPLRITTDN